MALPVVLSPGEQVYKFTLQSRIGGGTFGEVWLAHDQALKKNVAVKILDPSYASVSKLLAEAVVGHRTGHDNLTTVHYADVVSHGGTDLVAVVMDYYPDGSVLSAVCAGNFVPIQRAISVIIDILRGLEYLHEQDTLHNDIKPQNILIGANEEGILTDYGIAEVRSGAPTAKPRASYKLHKAPEVIVSNTIDPLTDLYQVGITAFRLINGVGHVGDKWNQLGETEYQKRVTSGKLITKSDYQLFVPPRVRRIITKAIDPDPAKRYQSALEMRRELEKLHMRGSWSVDAAGNWLGEDESCTYRFTIEPMRGGTLRLSAYRRYRKSGIERKISKFSDSSLSNSGAEKLRGKFMTAVVEGKL